jgi:hypothetical protein
MQIQASGSTAQAGHPAANASIYLVGATGNVDINTSTPRAPLEVNGWSDIVDVDKPKTCKPIALLTTASHLSSIAFSDGGSEAALHAFALTRPLPLINRLEFSADGFAYILA